MQGDDVGAPEQNLETGDALDPQLGQPLAQLVMAGSTDPGARPFPPGDYFRFYGLRPEHLALTRPDTIVMHPGPINRGREISSEVADSQRSVILNQVENGVAVRMAVLEKVMGA